MKWFNRHKPDPIPPDEILFYHEAIAAVPSRVEWVVFDCETTGLKPGKDRLLSIGAVRINGYEVQADRAFHEFVYQPEYKGEAAEVHGIGHGQVAEAQPEKAVVMRFLEFVSNTPVIGHHVGFDCAMIQEAMKRHWNYPFKNKRLDTVELTRVALPSHGKHTTVPSHHFSLDHLCRQLSIPIEDRHTALGDAYLTAMLFLQLRRHVSDDKLRKLLR